MNAKPMLDLRMYHVRYRITNIVAMVSWNLHTGEPCIVLLPDDRGGISFERHTPCVVPLSSAYMWAEETGDGAHCAGQAMRFAQALGRNCNDPQGLFRITAIIRDMLDDLVKCPPLASDARDKVADMIVTDNETGRIVEKEVSDHV